MNTSVIKILFYISALYDGILGLLFLLVPLSIFSMYNVTPPNHPGYVQFSAALLIIFGLMFYMIAKDPLKNYNLIIFGILLKISYCGIVFYYWLGTGIPSMWKPFAIADLVFLVLFIYTYLQLKKR